MSLVNRILQSPPGLGPLERRYPGFDADATTTAVGVAAERIEAADIHAGAVSTATANRLAELVAALDADTVIETGVASGLSTTGLLAGADRVDATVHSIDLPFRPDDDLEQRRQDTYGEFGGAHLPADADAGWVIPDRLRDRWRFSEGKSQRVLPTLLADMTDIDLFVHDSEHSRLCMSFELEAVWPRMRDGGVVVCDDLSWTGAWEEFVDRRVTDGAHGRLAHDVGYAIKGGAP
jgi:predicted O-methyltransferase YrrM